MTAIDDVLVSPGEAATEAATPPRRRIWPRIVGGFAIGFVLTVGVAAAALLAVDLAHEGRVLQGVQVGTVDLSGMDRAEARAALAAAYAGYADGKVVVQTSAGDVEIPYAAFGRQADLETMLDEAMAGGRTGTILERAVGEVRLARDGLVLPVRVVLDTTALETQVRAVLDRLGREPVNSQVVQTPTGWSAIPSMAGRSFDADSAIAPALAAVGSTDAPDTVVVTAGETELPPTHGYVEAQAAVAAADRMVGDVVVTHGKKKWTIKAPVVRTWIGIETSADGAPTPVLDEAAIAGSLAKVSKGVRVEAVSATYLKSGRGRIVGVVAAKDGRQLDGPATAKAIAAAVLARAGGTAQAPVAAMLASVAPKLSTAEAMQKGPLMVRLGTWKTWFPISERNYFGANIWQPAAIIDGTVLAPGQRFEWWSAIGPVTTARGFGPGGFIAGNHTEPTGALGGGMCSSSTTLFNAALRAGLQMGARSNHKYYINRYPLGLDATVSKTPGGGGQTLSFTNDMRTPIVIRAFRYRANGLGWVRYEIWGVPDGRTTSLSRPAVSNLREADTSTVYVDDLPRGVREQVEYPANGMDVSVSRVVRDRAGRVLHRETYQTHYVLWNGVIHIGR